jgi:hypothetical protein
MYSDFYKEFLGSGDTLRVYRGNELIFSSVKDGLRPLLEYIERLAPHHRNIVILDKITGNAAALLSVKAGCQEVYSPLGSQPAVKTLDRYGVRHHITEVVPYIQQPDGRSMCPMEKLSLDKGPEEFYQAVQPEAAGC